MRSKLPIFLLGFVLLSLQTAVASADDVSGSDVAGRPKQFEVGKKALCAVYYEDDQWHLRMTSAQRRVYTGSVRVEGAGLGGNFQALEKAKKAKDADYIVIHKDGCGFDFRFVTTGGADGVNFIVGEGAKTITFKIETDGDDDPKKIVIGGKGKHPGKATFTLPALRKDK